MDGKLQLFRRRYIPNELTWLKDDEIISIDEDTIVTKWTSLSPRSDFSGGHSVYYRKKGVKITKIFDKEGNFVHWYCDIVRECDASALNVPYECTLRNNAGDFIDAYSRGEYADSEIIVFEDLLADVVVKPDGFVYVVDLEELADAQKKELITPEMLESALETTNMLLRHIYKCRNNSLQNPSEALDIMF